MVASVDTSNLFSLKLFCTITKVITSKVRHFDVHTTVVSNLHATSFRALSFYYDDTVCSLRTIDSLSCSVFQQSDTFYHVHVQVHDLGHISFKTVQNKERLVRVRLIFSLQVCETCLTTHLEVRHGIRVRTGRQVVDLNERRVNVRKA